MGGGEGGSGRRSKRTILPRSKLIATAQRQPHPPCSGRPGSLWRCCSHGFDSGGGGRSRGFQRGSRWGDRRIQGRIISRRDRFLSVHRIALFHRSAPARCSRRSSERPGRVLERRRAAFLRVRIRGHQLRWSTVAAWRKGGFTVCLATHQGPPNRNVGASRRGPRAQRVRQKKVGLHDGTTHRNTISTVCVKSH